MRMVQTRRQFLAAVASAGAGALLGPRRSLAAEAPLETTTVRLGKSPAVCNAPQYVAEELLRAEGFTDIRYVEAAAGPPGFAALGRGVLDFQSFSPAVVQAIDAGASIVLLGGLHGGCYELFAREGIGGLAELKGKAVGVRGIYPWLLQLMAAQVGLDPAKDIRWVTSTASADPLELFAAGKLDGFLGFPPEPQELRARKVGRVIVNTATDHPWSQYYCCMLAANREFVRNNPVATKRVLRAILKAVDLCASEPAQVARTIVDRRFTDRYDYALQTFTDVPYDKWREYDAEDTIRFYSLRLHEIGMIKSSPKKIIADGTDWRFLNELKRELKM
jgi:NitT/TauT family transport system substrate-binding protein